MLKSKAITLLTKTRIVKAVDFPLDVYGCESWTMKKAERQRIDASELEKALESPLDCTESKLVSLKENQSKILFGRTDAEAEAPPNVMSQLIEKVMMLGNTEGKRRKGNRG